MQKAQPILCALGTCGEPSQLEPSDAVLLKRIAEGDKQAMDVLFRRHSLGVYRFARRLMKDAALADDIVSEVFLEAWRHAASFAGKSRVSTWLLAIARHKALSALRSQPKRPPGQDPCTLLVDSDNPEANLDHEDRRKLLRACLEQLPLAHREVIDLVYYHEKTIAEVAQILAAPVNTVKTRMFYARRNLAQALKQIGIDAPI